MGQKVSPIGFRVGVIRNWESKWFAGKEYGSLLQEDVKIRKYLFEKLATAAVSHVEIERSKNAVEVVIKSARPGVVMGTNAENINEIKNKIVKLTDGKKVNIRVVEVANPDLDARLVARAIADQLEARASFRTAQKRAIQKTMRAGAKGIKTSVGGRLGGADIARSEGYAEGVVPLHTIRADIDFASEKAKTTYGILGVKVWICRGEVLKGEMVKDPEAPKFNNPRNDRRRNNHYNNSNNSNNGNRGYNKVNKANTTAPVQENKEVSQDVNA